MNNKLKLLRINRGLSQWELASHSNVKQSRISLAERGLIKLNQVEMIRLSTALKTSVNAIFPDAQSENSK